jgi:hypothetical protein
VAPETSLILTLSGAAVNQGESSAPSGITDASIQSKY